MGANQSRGDGESAGESRAPNTRTCYYELLDVTQSASDEEIKKAYRKKALELHPDRNLDNVESATKRFADVQAAYEILSDTQERAWYDSHRDVILNADGDSSDIYECDVRITTTQDVLSFLRRSNAQLEFTDSPTGFFGALREFFASLAHEEEIVCQTEGLRCPSFPSFGHSSDSYTSGVRTFYSAWAGFATNKSFSWKDIYRLPDAPDRRVRRLMEKENKRIRDEAVREFNDAVRSLVAFSKKRDPRIPASNESEFDRQKILRDATAAQATRSKVANQAKNNLINPIPDWMKASEPADDYFEEEEHPATKEIIECIICKKIFKSENQFEAHERSKKHIKAVSQIQREMRLDIDALNLSDDDGQHDLEAQISTVGDLPSHPWQELKPSVDEDYEVLRYGLNTSHAGHVPKSSSYTAHEERSPFKKAERADDVVEMGMAQAIELPESEDLSAGTAPSSLGEDTEHQEVQGSFSDGAEMNGIQSRPKVGMAKAKRAKKAAQQSSQAKGSALEHRCITCQSTFPSKTKLFNHIGEFDHGQALAKTSTTKMRGAFRSQ